MRVSDYILKRLADLGVDTLFFVYGAAVGELVDALTRQTAIKHVCPMHEQAAGFMAEGYAKTKGVPGVALGTSGPGGHNMVTCIANFYYDSVPGIFLTGQVSTQFMLPKGSTMRQMGFQETQIADIVRPITKASWCLNDPSQAKYLIDDAIRICTAERPGPVLLDIPIDVQRSKI